MDGCCACCGGAGADAACAGPCWDCRGTGHDHAQAPCPTCAGPVPCDTIWVRGDRFFCGQKCAEEGPVLALPPGRR